MAINVNTVYQTVLLILNKEQRGYMTPLEFNKTGQQAQLEIFETYFDSLNQQIRVPQTDTDYADRVLSLDEKISLFKRTGTSAYTGGTTPFFSLPAVASTPLTSVLASTGVSTYVIPGTNSSQVVTNPVVTVDGVIQTIVTDYSFSNNVLTFTGGSTPAASLFNQSVQSPSGGSGSPNEFSVVKNAASNTITTAMVISGAGTVGTPTVASVDLAPAIGVWMYPSTTQTYAAADLLNFTRNITVSGDWADPTITPVYKLGVVNYSNGAKPIEELERVDRGELYHLLSSNLTKPTETYPVYLYENSRLYVYPSSIISGIACDYIQKPADPVWNFTVGLNNQYIYSSGTSVDFELHGTEQTELILKILLYAGVVIKSPEIVQVAAQQVAQENMNQQR